LVSAPRPGSPGPNPDGTTITLWWRSADAQATYEYLRAVGVPIGREPFDGPFGRQFTLTDPDGYKITIYEKDQPMFWPPRS
jgi:predicted enzyme related to lactoylglutathione lyase